MLARQSLAIDLPPGFLGVFIGIAFGFVIGLFYYQTYRKPYFWLYSISSSIAAAEIAPLIIRFVLHVDVTSLNGTIIQFGSALVAAILANHMIFRMNKRYKTKLRSSRRRNYAKDLAVAHSPSTATINRL